FEEMGAPGRGATATIAGEPSRVSGRVPEAQPGRSRGSARREMFMDQPLSELLFADAPAFDFFQAVRLLERLYPDRKAVGRDARAPGAVARLPSPLSLAVPPSALFAIERPSEERPWALVVQTFLGLTGPSGVLPRHYTQMLLDLGRDVKGPERRSLGDWLAL